MVHSGWPEKPRLWTLPSLLPAKSRNSCLQGIPAGSFLLAFYELANRSRKCSNLLGRPPLLLLEPDNPSDKRT